MDNRADGSAPGHVLRALQALPVCALVLSPERTEYAAQTPAHISLAAAPDAAVLFEALYAGEEHAVLLESSNLNFPDPRQRNRYSIMGAAATDQCASYEHRAGAGLLREGENTVEVRVCNTAANMLSAWTVPLEPPWVKMPSK